MRCNSQILQYLQIDLLQVILNAVLMYITLFLLGLLIYLIASNLLPSLKPDDEKHVHPLQLLDVIERWITLWSNPGDTVLTPFMGVGSEVYSVVRLGWKGIGIELKPSYFKQAVKNLEHHAAEQQVLELTG
jgi:DNA modification methylase